MAYITNRPEEERQSLLGGQGAIAGGAGGQGMSGAPQAGVSKGTGGSQPWVNIQSYLRANPADTSGRAELQKGFADPLNQSLASTRGKLSGMESALDTSKSAAESALSSVDKNLQDAKSAYRTSVLQSAPNIYGGAIQRANDAATAKYSAPEVSPVGLDSSLESKFQQISNPYQYLSSLYAGKGLNAGQRALQEQLTRKSTAFPQLAQALGGQYSQAKQEVESKNAELQKRAAEEEKTYRDKLSEAAGRASTFKQNQQDIDAILRNRNQWLPILDSASVRGIDAPGSPGAYKFKLADLVREVAPGTNSLTDLPKVYGSNNYDYGARDALLGNWVPAQHQAEMARQYKEIRDRLLSQYGFGA